MHNIEQKTQVVKCFLCFSLRYLWNSLLSGFQYSRNPVPKFTLFCSEKRFLKVPQADTFKS